MALRGVFPVVPTIFHETGELDLDGQRRAVDFMIPDYKNNKALGDTLAQYFIDNLTRLNGTYVIWRQRIWTPYNGRWKAMEDRGSDTANHMNHVHVSFKPS